MKKLAIIITGWHFPYLFFKQLNEQKKPSEWVIDSFVISHRNPEDGFNEKKIKTSNNILTKIDKKMYSQKVTKDIIENFGIKYIQKKNDFGNWHAFNQWTEDYDWKLYDLFFIVHDDTYLINDSVLKNILEGNIDLYQTEINNNDKLLKTKYHNDWLLLSNGANGGNENKDFFIRGSFDFFKKELLIMLNGQFSMNNVTEKNNLKNLAEWNKMLDNLSVFFKNKNLFHKVSYLSPYYRVSKYAIDGERGLLSFVNYNKINYEKGIQELLDNNILKNH